MIEVLPAFSYLHTSGLLYCDFKPANVIQVGESVKLIDLGGVRRIGDDESPIYGTVGFQAPEVAARRHDDRLGHLHGRPHARGARLRVQGFDERVRRLPADAGRRSRCSPSTTRCTGCCCGRRRRRPRTGSSPPTSCASSCSASCARSRRAMTGDFRLGAVDVLRDAGHRERRARVGRAAGAACRHRRPDGLVAGRRDVRRPGAIAGAARRGARTECRRAAWPGPTPRSAPVIHRRATAESEALLQVDPWDWRAVWMTGVAAMAAGDVPGAISAFNAVYGQVPGELAPKLALARACELADEREMATGLYAVCSRTDGAYLAAAQFGLARLAQADGRTADALAALGRIAAGQPGVRRSTPATGVAARGRRRGDAGRPRCGVAGGRACGAASTRADRPPRRDPRSCIGNDRPRWRSTIDAASSA